jgi:hypothetical protein
VNKTKKRGWFRSGEEDHEQRASESLPPPQVLEAAAAAPPAHEAADPRPSGEAAIDVRQLLESAGITREDRERVDRARALLQALPAGVSAPVRRQIVETSLTTFGVATDLIADAGQKVSDALASFIAANRQATDRLLDEARARVQALEQEILRVRQATEHATAIHEQRIRQANNEMVTVNHVLAFFGSGIADVEELDEPTEDRGDWGVEVPIPVPARLKRDTVGNSKPPPVPPGEPAGPAGPPKPHS